MKPACERGERGTVVRTILRLMSERREAAWREERARSIDKGNRSFRFLTGSQPIARRGTRGTRRAGCSREHGSIHPLTTGVPFSPSLRLPRSNSPRSLNKLTHHVIHSLHNELAQTVARSSSGPAPCTRRSSSPAGRTPHVTCARARHHRRCHFRRSIRAGSSSAAPSFRLGGSLGTRGRVGGRCFEVGEEGEEEREGEVAGGRQ